MSIVMATASDVELDPEPIPGDWILRGNPEARCKTVARGWDWTSHTVVWDCSSGLFNWHYSREEVVFVVSGEAFLLKQPGTEQRFGAGDVGFFPAGTVCTWRIDEHFRKVAVIREPVWRPLGVTVKVGNKLLRYIGIRTT